MTSNISRQRCLFIKHFEAGRGSEELDYRESLIFRKIYKPSGEYVIQRYDVLVMESLQRLYFVQSGCADTFLEHSQLDSLHSKYSTSFLHRRSKPIWSVHYRYDLASGPDGASCKPRQMHPLRPLRFSCTVRSYYKFGDSTNEYSVLTAVSQFTDTID